MTFYSGLTNPGGQIIPLLFEIVIFDQNYATDMVHANASYEAECQIDVISRAS